jgi:Short C-terminal domain
MIGRPMVRRRPLLRAAAVGGTFAAGRAMGKRAAQAQTSDQGQTQAQQGQQPPAPQPQGTQAAAAGQAQGMTGGSQPAGDSAVLDQLGKLTALHQQGALTDQEFAAAKTKILGG